MKRQFSKYYKFSNYWGEPSGIRRLDYIISMVKSQKKVLNRTPKILEVGCGNGNISITLASLGFDVTAIDVDEKSIETAKKNIPSGVKINFQVESAEELALKGESNNYDILICTEVLEHLSAPEIVMKSFKKLIAENGIAIITVPNGKCLEEQIRKFLVMTSFGQMLRKLIKKKLLEKDHVQSSNMSSSHIQYFSLNKMKKMLENSGLHVCETESSSVFFREAYYLFFRFFLKRGSRLFRTFDDLDNYLASKIGNIYASGWFFLCNIKR